MNDEPIDATWAKFEAYLLGPTAPSSAWVDLPPELRDICKTWWQTGYFFGHSDGVRLMKERSSITVHSARE